MTVVNRAKKYAARIRHWVLRDIVRYQTGIDREIAEDEFVVYAEIYDMNDLKEVLDRIYEDLEEVLEQSQFNLPEQTIEDIVDGLKHVLKSYVEEVFEHDQGKIAEMEAVIDQRLDEIKEKILSELGV